MVVLPTFARRPPSGARSAPGAPDEGGGCDCWTKVPRSPRSRSPTGGYRRAARRARGVWIAVGSLRPLRCRRAAREKGGRRTRDRALYRSREHRHIQRRRSDGHRAAGPRSPTRRGSIPRGGGRAGSVTIAAVAGCPGGAFPAPRRAGRSCGFAATPGPTNRHSHREEGDATIRLPTFALPSPARSSGAGRDQVRVSTSGRRALHKRDQLRDQGAAAVAARAAAARRGQFFEAARQHREV